MCPPLLSSKKHKSIQVLLHISFYLQCIYNPLCCVNQYFSSAKKNEGLTRCSASFVALLTFSPFIICPTSSYWNWAYKHTRCFFGLLFFFFLVLTFILVFFFFLVSGSKLWKVRCILNVVNIAVIRKRITIDLSWKQMQHKTGWTRSRESV